MIKVGDEIKITANPKDWKPLEKMMGNVYVVDKINVETFSNKPSETWYRIYDKVYGGFSVSEHECELALSINAQKIKRLYS